MQTNLNKKSSTSQVKQNPQNISKRKGLAKLNQLAVY